MSEELIEQISDAFMPNVFNPWRDSDPLDVDPQTGAEERRWRLRQHFDCEPEFLLIGEAPGYQGCHFSGVAFTNESLLVSGTIPRVTLNGRITTRPKPWCEPSATIVWGQLHAMGIADRTVMWNAFAWHPHKPGEPMSNRAPDRSELAAGAKVLKAVLANFPTARVVAVGNVAAAALQRAYVRVHATARHPSMGGASKFREQMEALGATA